ncbi:patatin-like phospholipase family protein [Spongisporangium articulatum]|uniref:Patatin-like phospholipase family protein n=1 Tax=Spongisporangium articulatum TaxID=3362603 RepID=A0ABW8AK52_9ACTN
MNTSAPTRALVLGGGGSTGNAWLIGVLAGLADAGLDVTGADLIVGTSAGSTAAAQITGTPLPELLDLTLTSVPPQQAYYARGAAGAAQEQMDRLVRLAATSPDPAEFRRRLGASALEREAATEGDWSTRWRGLVEARFTRRDWPDPVRITAIDARTGESVVFDRAAGVDLVDAVAASCSSGLPYAIGEDRYLDGGFRRSSENADLAAGFDRVLVLSPLGGRSLAPAGWGFELAVQVDELRAGGSDVEMVFPQDESLFGVNAMDLSLRPAAARAGFDQGQALAETLTPFWR